PEKNGTVTNTNRQVQMGRKALPCPGDTCEDWWITQELAKRLGLPWSYTGPSEVFAEMKQGMASLNNITWERLERESSVIYPSLSPEDPGQPVVFGDGYPRENKRAKFVPANVLPPAELPDAEYPMVLSTGRQLEHWHTGAMTRRAAVLDALEPSPTAYFNPDALAKMGVTPGGSVRVTTRRGSIVLAARADGDIQANMIFIPFAYVEAAANLLTNPQLDPFGKIPEYKFCAAKAEALEQVSA
ncbi:MAG: molybdopterin dinucleotide binding domain-containing protein, partial [Rhodomicrobium sp.]